MAASRTGLLARRFFLGLILGQFTTAGLWATYNALTITL